MREILFKAKRLSDGEWVEGYFLKKHGIPFIYEVRECPQNNYEIDEATLCQYTGLTDKNGNKIWENDVVVEDFGNYKGTVVFGEFASNVLNNLGFSIDWSDSGVYYRQDLPYWADKIEVLGNIFDNPELLEVHK